MQQTPFVRYEVKRVLKAVDHENWRTLPSPYHGPLGDSVLDLGESDAHAQLGRHEGEGVARCLRRQRRRTAETSVHLQ